jgi:iron complex transport system substrate-binding protein
MQADIDELVASVPARETPLTYYHELDPTLFTVTSSTFIGQLYGLAELESVADAADPGGEFGGYPQLSAEFLVAADPTFVFLADTECCGESADTFAARPGFADLSAVQAGNVVLLDDDVASRWGPRVVDFLRTIVESTSAVPVG